MEILTTVLAPVAIIVCLFLAVALSRLNWELKEERDVNNRRDDACRHAQMQAKGELDAHSDQIAKLAESAASVTRQLTELERRLHCVEEDLEKMPVEEVNAEVQRLELFNDGIASIMGYGPDVPKLNKEVLKHE